MFILDIQVVSLAYLVGGYSSTKIHERPVQLSVTNVEAESTSLPPTS
jgi:hypothetical protein